MTNSLGIVFPGQGSQSVGMLKDIALEYHEIKETFDDASSALGYDLGQLVLHGPAEELDKTVHTQPALLTASYAIWRILKTKNNIQPALLAGHSLGEYTALVCANAIRFADAVCLVAARGQYMQDAAPIGVGALGAIIGLDDESVKTICAKAKIGNEVISPANFNSPAQIVIAGHTKAVERALILAKEAGAKLAKLLPVSVPSHCILMKPAAESLAKSLEKITIQTPTIPVLSNVDVKAYDSPEAIRDGLTRQLFMPVRWVETIQSFANAGVTHIVECGPGKVLTGLNKRIDSNLQLSNTADLPSLQSLLDTASEKQ
jgi:[acyl-carrier-protein] S-malonyltransferase